MLAFYGQISEKTPLGLDSLDLFFIDYYAVNTESVVYVRYGID